MSEQAVAFLERIRPYLIYIIPAGAIAGVILILVYLHFRGKKKGKEE